jgi:hypothetical protein
MFVFSFLQDQESTILSYHVIFRHPFMYVFRIAFSQALVIQLVNSVVVSFGLLERLDGFVLVSSSQCFPVCFL